MIEEDVWDRQVWHPAPPRFELASVKRPLQSTPTFSVSVFLGLVFVWDSAFRQGVSGSPNGIVTRWLSAFCSRSTRRRLGPRRRMGFERRSVHSKTRLSTAASSFTALDLRTCSTACLQVGNLFALRFVSPG